MLNGTDAVTTSKELHRGSTSFSTANAPDCAGNGAAGLSPSKRGAPAGVTSRRTLGRRAPTPRVPTKAPHALARLLAKIRTKADHTPLPPPDALPGARHPAP